MREELVHKAEGLLKRPEGQAIGGRKMQETLRQLREQLRKGCRLVAEQADQPFAVQRHRAAVLELELDGALTVQEEVAGSVTAITASATTPIGRLM